MAHWTTFDAEPTAPSFVMEPAPARQAWDGPEDDRALARMLGAATLLGAGMTGGMGYGLWRLVAAALS